MGLGIRKNDTVIVTTGRERGKRGKVLVVQPKRGRVIVERINMVKKHMRPNKTFQKGGIIDKEAALNLSNVRLVCPKCDKPTRFLNKVLGTGKKVRVCKKCQEVIDK